MGPLETPTKFRGVAPTFHVADVLAASAYYRDKLGFAIRPVMIDSAGYWVIAERDSVEIQLVKSDSPNENRLHGCSILVDSVDQLAAELLARGANFESGPTSQEYGNRDFAVTDLDGHYLVFWQPLPPVKFQDHGTNMPMLGADDEDQPF